MVGKRVRKPAAEITAVLVGYTLLALYLTRPLWRDLNSAIWGLPGDSTGTISYLWLLAEKIGYPITGVTHMTMTGAPFGWDFNNPLNIQWAFPYFPAYLVAEVHAEILGYNLAILSGLVLSAASMYWLARRLGTSQLVAAWAGLVFMVFPWHLEKAQGHGTFVHLEGFPLLLLAVLAWDRKPDVRRALFVAGAYAVLWTTAGYFGVVGTIALAILLPSAALLLRRRGLSALRPFLVVAAATMLVPAVIFALTLTGGGAEAVSGQRSLGELHTYGARPWEYLLPSYRNPTFGDDVGPWLFGHLHGSNFSETSLYVGWLTIVLAVGWLAWAVVCRHRLAERELLAAVTLPALVLAASIFSLPSPLPYTEISTPSRVVWELVPQFRVPSRFVALVMSALVPLAALGLQGVRSRLERLPRGQLLGAAAVVIAAVVSFVELPIETNPATTDVSHPPPYVRALASVKRGSVAEYPLARSEQAVNSDYLFNQRVHGRRLINGAALDTRADAFGQALVNPVSPETASSLAALGVSEVVMRPSVYAFTGGFPPPARLGPGYRLVRAFPDLTSVWRVTARPAPAVAAYRTGFSHAETPRGGTWRWVGADQATVEIWARRSGVYRAAFNVVSYARARLLRIKGRTESRFRPALARGNRVSVALRLPRGVSVVRLDTRPGPEPIPDGRIVSAYVANWWFTSAPRARDPLEPFEASGS
jgi:hypothetical protein